MLLKSGSSYSANSPVLKPTTRILVGLWNAAHMSCKMQAQVNNIINSRCVHLCTILHEEVLVWRCYFPTKAGNDGSLSGMISKFAHFFNWPLYNFDVCQLPVQTGLMAMLSSSSLAASGSTSSSDCDDSDASSLASSSGSWVAARRFTGLTTRACDHYDKILTNYCQRTFLLDLKLNLLAFPHK